MGNKGMTLIETIVAIGLFGLLSVLVITMIDNSQKNMNSFTSRVELDNLMEEIRRVVTNREICSFYFKDKPIHSEYLELSNLKRFKWEVGKKYIKDTYLLKNIKTDLNEIGGINLVLKFEDVRQASSRKDYIKKIAMAVEHNGEQIESCYGDGEILSDILLEDINELACQGNGVVRDEDGRSCYFKSYKLPFPLPQTGEVLTDIAYQGDESYLYAFTFREVLKSSGTCGSHRRIRIFDNNGNIECLGLGEFLSTEGSGAIVSGASCGLVVNNGKIQLTCNSLNEE